MLQRYIYTFIQTLGGFEGNQHRENTFLSRARCQMQQQVDHGLNTMSPACSLLIAACFEESMCRLAKCRGCFAILKQHWLSCVDTYNLPIAWWKVHDAEPISYCHSMVEGS